MISKEKTLELLSATVSRSSHFWGKPQVHCEDSVVKRIVVEVNLMKDSEVQEFANFLKYGAKTP